MAPRAVNFLVGWSSGDTNTVNVSGLFSVSKSGGGSQTITRNVTRGTVYSVSSSGSGPGSTGLRIGAFGRLELDDRQGAGGDGDYNDLTILPNNGGFQNAGGSSAQYYWAPPSQLPTVQLYFNGSASDINITDGDNVNITWESASNDIFAVETTLYNQEGGVISNAANGGIVRSPSSNRKWKVTATNDLGSKTVERTVYVYPKPVITSFTISDSSPLSGQSVTISWTTTGANSVLLSGSPAGAFGSTTPSGLPTSGSFTFIAGTGGYYTAQLKAYNVPGYLVSTPLLNYTVRDETPNAFSFLESVENTPLDNQNRQSNSISVTGFGPTQYPNNALPIKSNHPIEIQVGGDGVWRNVQQI